MSIGIGGGASLVSIYEKFGPTHPGHYIAQLNSYSLHYPGLTFIFALQQQQQQASQQQQQSHTDDANAVPSYVFAPPATSNDGSGGNNSSQDSYGQHMMQMMKLTPVASRIYLYATSGSLSPLPASSSLATSPQPVSMS